MCPRLERIASSSTDVEQGVTVIVAHYGDPDRTTRCVNDIQAQQTTRPVEVVVVDDCAPSPYSRTHPDTIVVRRARNGGYGAALNTGASAASHSLLLMLNNDIRLHPGFIDELCRTAAPYMPAICGPATVEAGQFFITGRRFPRLSGQFVEALQLPASWQSSAWRERLTGRDLRCIPGRVIDDVDWLQGSALLLGAEEFKAVGGFDERFFMFSEEVDLQHRLALRGVRRVFIGTVEVEHEGNASTPRDSSVVWLQRSQLTYAQKWASEGRLRKVLRLAALLNLAVNLAGRATGRRTSPRHALRRQWRLANLPVWPPHTDPRE